MYDITMTTLTYIPWVIMLFYCIITPIVAFAEQDEIIYPLFVGQAQFFNEPTLETYLSPLTITSLITGSNSVLETGST